MPAASRPLGVQKPLQDHSPTPKKGPEAFETTDCLSCQDLSCDGGARCRVFGVAEPGSGSAGSWWCRAAVLSRQSTMIRPSAPHFIPLRVQIRCPCHRCALSLRQSLVCWPCHAGCRWCSFQTAACRRVPLSCFV